ncbi:MAG: flagellar motor switch protein FliG [Syntrophomonadaceae bacterium]|nr:flagellar motor switch protein FliG [Syntrophomonadaceae bacterium]
MARERTLTGLQKAAILLIAVGPERASAVLKHFHYDKIELISSEIANTLAINPQNITSVYKEFLTLSNFHAAVSTGGLQYAKTMLEKALGTQKSEEIIRALTSHNKPFHSIRKVEPKQIVNFINNEHPQTIALILSNLDPEQAAGILNLLPQDMQSDIAWRIATMERTLPEIIEEVESVLESRLSSITSKDFSSAGGTRDLVNILNNVDRGTEKAIIEAMEQEDPELAEEIRKMLFMFEDIVTLDDHSIRRIMREIDFKDLALALKGANEEVSDKIFRNISQRAGEMLQEDIELLGSVRVRDVEEKQQKIVQVIRRLDEAGEIVITRGGAQNAIIV